MLHKSMLHNDVDWFRHKHQEVVTAVKAFATSMNGTCKIDAHEKGKALHRLLVEMLHTDSAKDYEHAGLLFSILRDAVMDL